MTEFEEKISIAALGYFGAISSVLLGAWLTNFRTNSSIRKDHRRVIRAIRSDLTQRPWEVLSCGDRTKEWWITAVEDYGFIRRWRISSLIESMGAIELPVPDWDINIETDGTPEQKERHNRKMAALLKSFEDRINRVLRWA